MTLRNLIPLVLFASAAACAPTLPPHLGEGTEVLAPGHVNLNIAGGAVGGERVAGGPNDNQFGAGAEVRSRVGLPGKQELGVSFFGGAGTSIGNGDPPFGLGGKLSYKIAPTPWLAFVASGGALYYRVSATAAFGGDLAVIVAPYTAPNGNQLYLALKGAFSIPVLQGATGANEAIIVPIGFSLHTSERVRFFIEGGPIAGFSQLSTSATNPTVLGGYSILAVTFILR